MPNPFPELGSAILAPLGRELKLSDLKRLVPMILFPVVTAMLWAFDSQPLKYLQDITDCQWRRGLGRSSFAKGMMIK